MCADEEGGKEERNLNYILVCRILTGSTAFNGESRARRMALGGGGAASCEGRPHARSPEVNERQMRHLTEKSRLSYCLSPLFHAEGRVRRSLTSPPPPRCLGPSSFFAFEYEGRGRSCGTLTTKRVARNLETQALHKMTRIGRKEDITSQPLSFNNTSTGSLRDD